MVTSHRSSSKNHKKFKSKHATKGALKAQNKGKIEKTSVKSKNTFISKINRNHHAKQQRLNKQIETNQSRKLFEGPNSPSRIVSIITLSDDIDPYFILDRLTHSVEGEKYQIKEQNLNSSNDNINSSSNPVYVYTKLDRFKQKIQYIVPKRNFISILDACQVADFVIFALSATTEVDNLGTLALQCVINQGISNVLPIICNLNLITTGVKKQEAARKSLLSFFNYYFPTQEKLYSILNDQETINAVRYLSQHFPKGVSWRDSRSYMLIDNISYEKNSVNNEHNSSDDALIALEGVVRGKPLNPDRLLHIPGYADFKIESVRDCTDKMRLKDKKSLKKNNKTDNMDIDGDIEIDIDDDNSNHNEKNLIHTSKSDDVDTLEDEMMDDDKEDLFKDNLQLDSNGIPTGGVRMDSHLYLPENNEDDEDNEDDDETGFKKHKRLPKGMSEYQARWIIDDDFGSDVEYEDEDADKDGDNNMGVTDNGSKSVKFDDDISEIGDNTTEPFVELSQEEETRQLEAYRKRERDEMQFPDEIELKSTELVRKRLRRYRGLKSFSDAEWNPDEVDSRAPRDWFKLLRFMNFRGTRNRVLREADEEINEESSKIPVGHRVIIYIRTAAEIAEKLQSYFLSGIGSVASYSLHKYEDQQAVLNFSIMANEDYKEPIKSKETLVCQYGFRRLIVNPLYSNSNASGFGVSRYERFLRKGSMRSGTFIGPVMFGSNIPAMFFKENGNELNLIGTGSLNGADHRRVLVKRVVLTGHPYRIHKKIVTVRYMFFNPEDVEYFQALELFTKSERTGFIKETLGTHGYFKAKFDGKLSAQDTIGVALYKRVWPRISTDWSP